MSWTIYRGRRSCAVGVKRLLEVAEEAREAGFYAGHRELRIGRDNGNHWNKNESWCLSSGRAGIGNN